MFTGSITLILSIIVLVFALITKIGWAKSISISLLTCLIFGGTFMLYFTAITKQKESNFGVKSLMFGNSAPRSEAIPIAKGQQEQKEVVCDKQDYESLPRDARFYTVRIDDIQDDYYYDIVESMIADSEVLGIKPVLGVIPDKIEGSSKMTNLLRKKKCMFEIAQHGLDHERISVGQGEFAEFESLSYEDAYDKIVQGRDSLIEMGFADVETFIPPENLLSQDAREAVEDIGFSQISSNDEAHFDSSASVYQYNTKKIFSPHEILTNCEDQWLGKNLCVITVHPQDFTTLDGEVDWLAYDFYFYDLLALLNSEPDTYSITFAQYSNIYNY